MGRWADAVKLFERAVQLADEALKADLESSLVDELRALVAKIESCRMIMRAKSMIQSVPPAAETSAKKEPLVNRLDEYFEDPSLVTGEPRIAEIPPPMVPIPCKPLFFDLALNMATFPSLDEKVARQKGVANPAGIKGFVKGLWGWNNPK